MPNSDATITSPTTLPQIPVAPLIYQQVEQEVRQLTKTLPVGARLPSERSMARLYNCNFLTVRKALRRLVDEGRIVRQVGSGTFVSEPPPESVAKERRDAERRMVAGGDASSTDGQSSARKIGILVLTSSNTYANRLLQEIAHTALNEGIEISSRWVRNLSEDALPMVEQLREDGCGALVLPWFPPSKADAVREFVALSPLEVSLSAHIPGLERNCFFDPASFGLRSQRAVEALFSYYLALGIKTIAFLGPESPEDVILQKTLTTYACRAAREGLPAVCGLISPDAKSMGQLAARWKALCQDGTPGIISYDDEHALRFMTAMHKAGMSAPADYRIIGFNDTEASAFSDPPLSTIPQDFAENSIWLLRNALALAAGEVNQSPNDCSNLRLLVRETCGGKPLINEELCEKIPELKLIPTTEDHFG